jgi:transcriptional regulator with XRE-family HTH domain
VVTVERRLKVRDAVCPMCSTTFEAVGRGTYCSPSCRRKADHQRHGDARRAANRERYRARRTEAARDSETAAPKAPIVRTVAEWRETLDLTQVETRRRSGLTTNVISLLERGRIAMTVRRRTALARAFRCRPEQIAHVVAMGDGVMRVDELGAPAKELARRLGSSEGGSE